MKLSRSIVVWMLVLGGCWPAAVKAAERVLAGGGTTAYRIVTEKDADVSTKAVAEDFAGDRLILEGSAGTTDAVCYRQLFKARNVLLPDQRAVLEWEAVMIDGIGRADGDTLPAVPAVFRANSDRAAFVELEHPSDVADIHAGSAADAGLLIYADGRHFSRSCLR